MIPSSFGYYKLDISVFCNIFHSISRNWINYQVEKTLFQSFADGFVSFAFILKYGFNHAF